MPSSSPHSKPTVIDVARAARVAVGTVSRVVNTPELVGPDLRQTVLDTIERLGYRPLRRRELVRGRGRIARLGGNFGVLLVGMDQTLEQLPVTRALLRGAEKASSSFSANLLFASLPKADKVPLFLSRRVADGVILQSPLNGDWRACAHPDLVRAVERLPHVWLLARPPSAQGDLIGCDTEKGARAIVKYLRERGHQRVAYMHPRPLPITISNMKHAFELEAIASGMSVTTIEGSSPDDAMWPPRPLTKITDFLPLVDRWREIPRAERPTVILVRLDAGAALVYKALAERGLQVGRDVSVMSLRKEKDLGAGLTPSLATLEVPAEAIGRRAVNLLRWRLAHPEDRAVMRILLEPTLVSGDSVAQLR